MTSGSTGEVGAHLDDFAWTGVHAKAGEPSGKAKLLSHQPSSPRLGEAGPVEFLVHTSLPHHVTTLDPSLQEGTSYQGLCEKWGMAGQVP